MEIRLDARDGDLRRKVVAVARGLRPASLVSECRAPRILDLFAEDSRRRVYAGELEVHLPGAPTTGPDTEKRGRWVYLSRLIGGACSLRALLRPRVTTR